MRTCCSWLSLGLGLLCSPRASAQERPGEPLRLPAFDRSVASSTSSESVSVNPANPAYLPSHELRLTSRTLDDRAWETAQGHAVTAAFRVPVVGLVTALRLDLLDPPSDAARRSFGLNANYQWLTWGVAYQASPALAFGTSVQGSWSKSPALDGLSSWSIGATLRPSDILAIGLAAQDLNGPGRSFTAHVHPAYHAGLAIRPTGRRALELNLGGAFVKAAPGYWISRAGLDLDLPSFGRLGGEFSLIDPLREIGPRRWLAAIKLTVRLNDSAWSAELGAGSLAGDALGPDARWSLGQNLSTTVAVRSFRERPAIGRANYALRVLIEDSPSARRHVSLLRRLWAIAEREPEVKVVVLQLRAAAARSVAHIEELRDALWLLRSRGKKVLCQLEDAGGITLYLCSAADRIVLGPAGRLRFAGMNARYFYVPRLLQKLGVQAEYARIGAHKSAPEMFSHEQASDVARADHIDLLQQFERRILGGIATGRKLPPLDLRRRIAEGPFSPAAALRAGLIDRVIHSDQIEAEASELHGSPLALREDRAPLAAERYDRGRAIALVTVDGDMIDGRSRRIPLLGLDLAGSYTLAEAIQRASANPRIGAIVLRLETPGGSALAADLLWRQLWVASSKKPLIVSIGGIGASAGYYIASAGARIYANPLSVTGSIGVFAGKVDASALLRKLGVTIETYKTAPRADADSLFRALTPDERQELQRKVGQFYDTFLDRVSRGRTNAGVQLSRAEVDSVGQGRVFTGEQAATRRLVDELGGLRQALAEARRRAGLAEDAPILELPEESGHFIHRMLGLASAPRLELLPAALAAPLDPLTRALGPLTIYPQQWPLLRMEFVAVE